MPSSCLSLYDLLAEAHDHCLRGADPGEQIRRWLSQTDQDDELGNFEVTTVAIAVANRALAAAWRGDHALALRIASLKREVLSEEQFNALTSCRLWIAFIRACELAERIDAFLSSLERGGPAALSRGCREELRTLTILADWCEEHGLFAAADEARHLHGLVLHREA